MNTDPNTSARNKKLKVKEITFFIICSIITVDALAPASAIGVQSFFAWFLGILFFFIPYSLVTAELGSTYRGSGAIYHWVKLGLGDFSATMVSWIYWINVALWIPSVFVTFSNILVKVLFSQIQPEYTNTLEAMISITMIWLLVFLGIRSRNVVELFTNTGAVAKIFVLGSLGILGIIYGSNSGFKTDFSTWDIFQWKPEILGLVPVIIFNFLGLEVVYALDKDLERPFYNFPISILISGILICGIYIFSTLGILSILEQKDINLVSGISDALLRLIYESLGPNFLWFYYAIVIALLYGLFATALAWAIGSNTIIFETGLDEQIKTFSHRHKKYGTPDYAYYLMGTIASITYLLNFVGVNDVQQIYWTIFAISTFLFLIPYCFMFLAFYRLRIIDPGKKRYFKVPFGKFGALFCTISGFITTFFSCILFFLSPAGITDITRYRISLVIGVGICLVIGVAIHAKKRI